jgi:hypothetical protein
MVTTPQPAMTFENAVPYKEDETTKSVAFLQESLSPVVIDTNVSGQASVAANGARAYVIYQSDKQIFVSWTDNAHVFQPRMSLVTGAPPLLSCGPAIACDTTNKRVLIAYVLADQSAVVVYSSDLNLSAWALEAKLALLGNPLQPGLSMVCGQFSGKAATFVYAVAAGSGKVIIADSRNWGAGFHSVYVTGATLQLPPGSGIAVGMQNAASGIVDLAMTASGKVYLAQSYAGDGNSFKMPATGPAAQTATPPSVMVQPDNGAAWIVWTNASVYYSVFSPSGGSWSPVGSLGFPSNQAQGPGSAWNGFTGYVACVDTSKKLTYITIVIG